MEDRGWFFGHRQSSILFSFRRISRKPALDSIIPGVKLRGNAERRFGRFSLLRISMLNFNHLFGPADAPSKSIPPKFLTNELGEVSLRRVGEEFQIAAALAMGANVIGDGETCRVGLALDASESMKDDYGRGKRLTREESQRFIDQGLIQIVERDGVKKKILTREARKEAERQGLGKPTSNKVQEPALRLIEFLIRTFATGGATRGECEVIYWACGNQGRYVEALGPVNTAQLLGLTLDGPAQAEFGPHTHLAPAFDHLVHGTPPESSGVLYFVTDGRIDDEQKIVDRTIHLAKEIKAKERASIKCVLIGIGKQVDQKQFERIDDMQMPEELADYDIWNSKIFDDMRDLADSASEIFDPDTIVGTTGRVYDDQGRIVEEWTDGVKALLTFRMPAKSRRFSIDIEGVKIQQDIPDSVG